jgi:hypothetical protein
MHRLTARLLLTLMLVGIFAPLALAVSAPAQHACCMRKPMHEQGTHRSEINSPADHCQHDCCRALVGLRSAQLRPLGVDPVAPASSHLTRPAELLFCASRDRSSNPGRAPPQLSIA